MSENPPPDAPVDALSPTLGVHWEPAAANPVIGDGACPGWHCIAATDPALARRADGSIVVWFSTVGIVSDGNGGYNSVLDIGRATGADGDTITLSATPDAAVRASTAAMPAWDAFSETWEVQPDPAGGWNAWYLAYSAEGFVGASIGQSHSLDADGTSWQRTSAPIYTPTQGAWDSALITGPSVVKGPDGTWRLYYSGIGLGGASIGMLTSTDGVTWKPYEHNPVFAHAPAGAWDSTILESTVRYFAGRYWIWYSAYDGELTDTTRISIGLATSTDGVTWERYANNPVLSPGASGSWNDYRVVSPSVVVEPDGSLLMAAHGQRLGDPMNNEPGKLGLWRSR